MERDVTTVRSCSRIVSLLPSATEIVAALGLADCLVGRSHECDFPEDVLRLPICCRPRIDTSLSGVDIDRQVKDCMRDGLSIYQVDADQLRDLRPDVILTQTQCEVCAVTPRDVEAALRANSNSQPQLINLRPQRLEDLFADIATVASALSVADRGGELIASLRQRLDDLRQRTVAIENRPRVACLEWFEPLMTAGNWIPELVDIAGGKNVGAEAGQHSPWSDWNSLLAVDPDLIVLLPCGWDIPRARQEAGVLTGDSRWHQLSAVRDGCVFVTDGHQFFNRPGPRLIESAEILAEILHQKVFDFGHRGRNWEAL